MHMTLKLLLMAKDYAYAYNWEHKTIAYDYDKDNCG